MNGSEERGRRLSEEEVADFLARSCSNESASVGAADLPSDVDPDEIHRLSDALELTRLLDRLGSSSLTMNEVGQPKGWTSSLHAPTPDEPKGSNDSEPDEFASLIKEQLRQANDWSRRIAAAASDRFVIKKELGSGGFGTVFLADDAKLKRAVALKIPHARLAARPNFRERIQRELASLKKLEHPGIVALLDAVEFEGYWLLVFDHIRGRSLEDWLRARDQGSSLDSKLVIAFVVELADAVQFAHQQGVLHRDIKPSNVLLCPKHEIADDASSDLSAFRPLLADFGLARFAEDASDLTASQAVIGTLAFMAPEQATGRNDSVGAWSDVYSLGRIFETLLSTRKDSIREIDKRLKSILARCLRLDPADRYQSAAAMAEDLRRWQRGVKPKLAGASRSLLPREQWAVTVMALVAIVISGMTWWSVRRNGVNTQMVEAVDSLDQRHRYVAGLKEADQQIRAGEYRIAESTLEGVRKKSAWGRNNKEPDVAFRWLQSRASISTVAIGDDRLSVYCIRYSPDGKLLAGGLKDGTVRIWDPATGRQIAISNAHVGDCNSVSFSGDGTQLASCGDDGAVCLFDIAGLKRTARMTRHKAAAVSVAFAPDSKWVVSGGGDVESLDPVDDQLLLWNVKEKRLEHDLGKMRGRVDDLAFNKDGTYLAVAQNRGGFDVFTEWRTASPKSVYSSKENIAACSWSRSQNLLAYRTSSSGIVVVAGASSGFKEIERIPMDGSGSDSTAWSPDDRYLATISFGRVVAWDRIEQRRAGLFAEQPGRIWSVTFAPVSNVLASAQECGPILVRQDPIRTRYRQFIHQGELVQDSQIERLDQNARQILLRIKSPTNCIRIINVADGTIAQELTAAGDSVRGVACSTDSDRIFWGSGSGKLSLHERSTGKLLSSTSDLFREVVAAAFVAKDRVRFIGLGKEAEVYEITESKGHLGVPQSITRLGDQLHYSHCAFIEGPGDILCWHQYLERLILPQNKLAWRTAGNVQWTWRGVAVSADKQWICGTTDDNALKILNARTGAIVGSITSCEHPVTSAAFSNDAKYLVVGDVSGRVALYDFETNQEVASLGERLGRIAYVTISANERSVVAVSILDSTRYAINVWDLVNAGTE